MKEVFLVEKAGFAEPVLRALFCGRFLIEKPYSNRAPVFVVSSHAVSVFKRPLSERTRDSDS